MILMDFYEDDRERPIINLKSITKESKEDSRFLKTNFQLPKEDIIEKNKVERELLEIIYRAKLDRT